MSYATATENMAYLQDFYCRGLLDLQPTSILDVGCGGGTIMRRCQESGVAAVGLEGPGRDPADLPVDAERVVISAAQQLPFADESFDWVCMRHVPHHLADPAKAFAEAMRVCRRGFYVAEPWFNRTRSSQLIAERADLWLKRQHRRTGMVHEPNFDHRGMLDLLPQQFRSQVEMLTMPGLPARDPVDFFEKTTDWLGRLPTEHSDVAVYKELCTTIKQTGIAWNGSMVLTVSK